MTFGNITLIAEFEELEVTINYVVVGPDGCGEVEPESEIVPKATGSAAGSEASVTNSNYRFIGWYADEECTVELTTDAKYVPVTDEESGLWEEATYYAKFEWNLTTMKITKTVVGDIYDADDTFRFRVYDEEHNVIANITLKHGESVTIKDVVVGDRYTVEELSSSNRYTIDDASKEIIIEPPTAENEVTFVNTSDEDKWLGATDAVKNVFGGGNFLQNLFGN